MRSKSRSRSKKRSRSKSRSIKRNEPLKLIKIIPSHNPKKKYDAYFSDGKIISFGAKGMSDYTIHKDPQRRYNYFLRHSAREDFDNVQSPGSLSAWILWGPSTSLRENIYFFKERYNL